MTKTVVLMLPGTGCPNGGDGITEDFFYHLPADQFDTRIVTYSADGFGRGEPFNDSRAVGRAAMLEILGTLPPMTPVVIGGYSQGAVIAGDLAAELAAEPNFGGHNIVAVALIADGKRPHGIGVVPAGATMAEGYGVMGERYPGHGMVVRWAAAWGDPIASLPAGNPLRTVADLIGWFAVRNTTDLTRWGAAMLDTVAKGRLQDWWAPWKWSGWTGAAAFARGFVFDGRHTLDYILKGHTRALADQIISDDIAHRSAGV